jgi:uncharacterized protein YdcH (DUF465 family)
MRGYELIYPSSSETKNTLFEKLLAKSNQIWDDFTTGKNKNKKNEPPIKMPKNKVQTTDE